MTDSPKTTPPIDFYDPEYLKNARKSEWYSVVTHNLTKCPLCDLKQKYVVVNKKEAVLSVNLFPYIDGHLMVIPTRHIEDFSQISAREWSVMRGLLSTGIELISSTFGVENTNVLYRQGALSGMSLKHLHIHILPITKEFLHYENQKFIMEFQEVKYAPLETAELLRQNLKKLKHKT